MSLIVFFLVIAVVWLFVRTSTLSEANDEMRAVVNVLTKRLQALQDAQKAGLEGKVVTPPPMVVTTAFVPPPPIKEPEPPPAIVVQPEPEPVLADIPVELRPWPEVMALMATPTDSVAAEVEMQSTPMEAGAAMPSVRVEMGGELEAVQRIPTPPPPLPTVASIIPPPPVPAAAEQLAAMCPALERADATLEPQTSDQPKPPTPVVVPPPAPVQPQSFELRLGTYWFVRAGVVILLTGLVFLANLAYREWITQMGAGGKLTLLYLASGALLGAGAWLQRKAAQASLNNFAHVLLAGGMGAIYFTTYAAHHYEPLRVIDSAALDGALLLAWAGFIVWLADRKKSETLALFALGLGYYTGVVTHVGTFTLCSNLVLTIATVFFLVRNRWAHLTLAGLVASYGGFAFWRFFHDGHWLLAAPRENLLLATAFLAGYWVCFTAATFLAEGDLLADKRRAAFLSANNGAFFALVLLSMATNRGGHLWQFCLGFGAVLLGLATFARLRLPQEPSVRAAYVTQGLLLITVGLIIKFTGHQLAVLLAAESVVLLTLGLRQPSRLLRAGAFVAAALAVGWLVLGWEPGQSVVLGIGVTGLLLFNAWWMGRNEDPADAALLRARTAWLSVLALIAGGAAISQHVEKEFIALWLMGAGVVLTLSVHALRTREIALFAQGYLLLAHGYWLFANGGSAALPAWRPVLLLIGSLVLLHWWTRQTVLGDAKFRTGFEAGYAVAVVALLHSWLHGYFTDVQWLTVASTLAVVVAVYGALTRAWRLAAVGQFFALVATVGFARHIQAPSAEWGYALAPIAMLLIISIAVQRALAQLPDLNQELRVTLQVAAGAYQWTSLGMVVAMVFSYVPVSHRPWSFAVLGGILFAYAGLRRTPQTLVRSGILLSLGLLTLLAPSSPSESLFSVANLLAVLLPLALQQIARRAPERFPLPANAHVVVLLFAGGFLWLQLTRWLSPERDGHFFTVAWSVLGPVFFVAGMWLKERTYYILGLGCICVALFRVLIHDAWQPELFVLNLLPMFVMLALQRAARKHPEGAGVPDAAHVAAIAVSGLSLWLFLTRWVLPEREGHFLTMAWSLLGPVFFVMGLWLRERTYFVLGLGCICVALFRVVTHDAWQPELFALNLLPMFAMLGLQRVARKHPEGAAIPDAAHVAAIAVSGLSLWLFLTRWLMPVEHGFYLTLAWSLLAPVFFVVGAWLRERSYFLLGLGCLGAALLRSVTHDVWQPNIALLNLLPAIFALVLQRVLRKHPDLAEVPDTAHTAAILVTGLSLWLYLSRWVVQVSGGKFFLTASWVVLALAVFAAGFAMRERVYRWLGLAVLAGALGRVVVLDVWQLAQVYRVLSFMALGIALIVLGYVYNRWQDKIREWL